ncbi:MULTISPECIES: hypothetical protein [unclassified Burkholderia]|uniref:hypothetical protein n=1 Tax=unclassified Burkholderia TaxID=2613784 RepID=UPI002AB1D36F|nr:MULTISPECIES: hypothetical protein [unclassified Burkholderia]
MPARVVERDLHEIPAERRILDVRPWTVKLAEWLAFRENFVFLVGVACLISVVVPLVTPLTAVTILTATIINRRTRAVMPLRYPAGSFAPDKANKGKRMVPGLKDKENKPVEATGIMLLGNQESSSIAAKGREIWLADDDLRKHVLVLGATGSGKSETLKSICYNALCWSSGFFIADGKADNKLATDANTLARRFGVENNFLCLNFLLGGSTPQEVANSRRKRSNSLNPFRTSDADTIIQMGANLMPKVEGEGKQWQEKALAFWRAIVNALCYKRDHDSYELSIDTFLEYLALDKVEQLYIEGYDRRDPKTGAWPYGFDGIKAYLESGLPGYAVDKLLRKYNKVAPSAPAAPQMGRPPASNDQGAQTFEQHGYRANQMQPALGLLANTYGHIFKHRYPEIDMVDVVLNDRILVTLIPPLEKSSQEAENLGKLAIACLRVMMARNLGTDIEGSREELIDSKATAAPYPYLVALDELGYYFADGIAVMFAQARSLGFSMIALAQDLEKLTEGSRAAEAGAMMGNQVSKFFMRIDDAQKTWNLVKEVLGRVPVAVVRSFMKKGGGWERTEEAAIEFVEPVQLQDLQRMTAGEGILSSAGERIHLRSLYIGDALAKNKTFRLNRFLQVPPPSQEAIDRYSDPLDVAADPVEKGKRLMAMLRGETSVDYPSQPDALLNHLGNVAHTLPSGMSAEERGIVLYMVARAEIMKKRQASARDPGTEKPEDQSDVVVETAGGIVDGVVDPIEAATGVGAGGDALPFQRKDAKPIVDILEQEIAHGAATAAPRSGSLLDSLDLLPGLNLGVPAVPEKIGAKADEQPAVWDDLPFGRATQEAEARIAGPEPVDESAPDVGAAKVEARLEAEDAPSAALPFHLPDVVPVAVEPKAAESSSSPAKDASTESPTSKDGESRGSGIAGFDLEPAGGASEPASGFNPFPGFGAFDVSPTTAAQPPVFAPAAPGAVGKRSADDPSTRQSTAEPSIDGVASHSHAPLRLPEMDLPEIGLPFVNPSPTAAVTDSAEPASPAPLRDAAGSTTSAGSTSMSPEWNDALGWAFKRLLGPAPAPAGAGTQGEAEKATAATATKALPTVPGPVPAERREPIEIPVNAEGKVDIPVDDQGRMIGMSDAVVDRVRRLDDLMNQAEPDVSLATLEAEIAIQVTPPQTAVQDDASQKMTEDDVMKWFTDLAEDMRG